MKFLISHHIQILAYKSFFHRLIDIPLSSDNFNKELNIIKQIAFNNGYNESLIENILKKKQY